MHLQPEGPETAEKGICDKGEICSHNDCGHYHAQREKKANLTMTTSSPLVMPAIQHILSKLLQRIFDTVNSCGIAAR